MPVHIPRNPRLPATFPAGSRRQLYEEAFRPLRLHGGTYYPCTGSELQDATTLSNRPIRRLISNDEASYNIQASNVLGANITQQAYDAIRRLEQVILGVFDGRVWGPDLIIKAFCDLDRVFFLGHLRGQVYVRWRPASWFPARRRHRLTMGRTEYLGGNRAVIYLNADGIFADVPLMSAFKETWRTMLHEMCHAYQFIRVARVHWEGRERHDLHIGTKSHAVHERARREIHVGALHRGEVYNQISYEARRTR